MMRLDKLLSNLNYGSRKEVKQYIRKGYVMVNGEEVYDDDFKVDEVNDEITFGDFKVNYEQFIYLMLNKPKDYVSATVDPRYPTVIELAPLEYQKMGIFPVGRLDVDTEGLLILTNDGVLAHKLLSPKFHVDKKYYVEFEGTFKDDYFNAFIEGITLDDGYLCMSAKCELIDDNKAYLTIKEGKYHQVKRMFEALNMKVTYLKRVSFKTIKLDENLPLGSVRCLTKEEIEELKDETR